MSYFTSAVNNVAELLVKSKRISTQQEKNLFEEELKHLPVLSNLLLHLLFISKYELLNNKWTNVPDYRRINIHDAP